MLMGKYTHAIDAKNRIIIPSRLKEQLGPVITMLKAADHCLTLYSAEEWTKYTDKLSTSTNSFPSYTGFTRRSGRLSVGKKTGSTRNRKTSPRCWNPLDCDQTKRQRHGSARRIRPAMPSVPIGKHVPKTFCSKAHIYKPFWRQISICSAHP